MPSGRSWRTSSACRTCRHGPRSPGAGRCGGGTRRSSPRDRAARTRGAPGCRGWRAKRKRFSKMPRPTMTPSAPDSRARPRKASTVRTSPFPTIRVARPASSRSRTASATAPQSAAPSDCWDDGAAVDGEGGETLRKEEAQPLLRRWAAQRRSASSRSRAGRPPPRGPRRSARRPDAGSR